MAKNKKIKEKNNRKTGKKREIDNDFDLPIKKWISIAVLILLIIIIVFSFFEKSGIAGKKIFDILFFLIGRTIYILPLILLVSCFAILNVKHKNINSYLVLVVIFFIFGISGLLETFETGMKPGGIIGQIITFPFIKFFDILITQIIFSAIIFIAGLISWHLLKKKIIEKTIENETQAPKIDLINKIFPLKFKVKQISNPSETKEQFKKILAPISKPKLIQPTPSFFKKGKNKSLYRFPPTDLLEDKKEFPSAGDTMANVAIIKKTLENFSIPIEMSEVNIGPTVTQYSFKPAEGIKLSKITSLSNDLALALASHPIRIEAPIPGKSLVGVEVPNKIRAQIGLKNLIKNQNFQKTKPLYFVLGNDVSGNPMYADLARMPHLLVAGSTGTGKTIFLNSIILSFIYKNSPEFLKFILIDPKRVEFPIFNDLPHLLTPVICNATQSVVVLKWLIIEMEKRFELLADVKTRDIDSYNEKITNKEEVLPYIILIIDELADLMAARGKEIEASIVRLAQMARAVGIHLVVATQRPSVEVITGLIKANITSRVAFQVASQIDSRTIIDSAGAEKLLGRGDLLYLSSGVGKPKRIQAAYISEKEIKKVVSWIKENNQDLISEMKIKDDITQELLFLQRKFESSEQNFVTDSYSKNEEPLYEKAKKVIIQAKKASASLLQRRLQIGYARAARILDMLEQDGVIGPAEGAKPREIYISENITTENNNENREKSDDEDEEGWHKI